MSCHSLCRAQSPPERYVPVHLRHLNLHNLCPQTLQNRHALQNRSGKLRIHSIRDIALVYSNPNAFHTLFNIFQHVGNRGW